MPDLSADRPLPFTKSDVESLGDVVDDYYTRMGMPPHYRPFAVADLVLNHLAAAGRLLPPDADHREAYVLASGEYSDFRVHATFVRREDAEAAMHAGAGDDVLDLPLYPVGVVPESVTEYSCNATVADSLDNWVDREPWVYEHRTWDYHPGVEHACVPSEGRNPSRKERWFRAVGHDREAVVKSVSDRYAKARSERDGL